VSAEKRLRFDKARLKASLFSRTETEFSVRRKNKTREERAKEEFSKEKRVQWRKRRSAQKRRRPIRKGMHSNHKT